MGAPYWAEALATATYLLNRRPCSAVQNNIPYQLLYSQPPEYSHLCVFGCLCYPNLSATARHKLAPRSAACVFLGYPSSHKGYRCLDLSTRRVIISRHVVFDESVFPFSSHPTHPSQLDFLLPSPFAAPTLASVVPSSDVAQPQPSPAVLQELPDDDPAILVRGPVVYRAPSAGGTPPSSSTAGPDRLDVVPAPAVGGSTGRPVPTSQLVSPLPRHYTRRPPAAAAPASAPPATLTPMVLAPAAQAPTPLSPPPAPAAPQAPAVLASSPPPAPTRPVTRTVTGAIQWVSYQGLTASPSLPSPLPANYRSALADTNWRAAMVEFQVLMDNEHLAPRPTAARCQCCVGQVDLPA